MARNSYNCTVLDLTPKLYWTLDDLIGSGNQASDLSGNGYHGTYQVSTVHRAPLIDHPTSGAGNGALFNEGGGQGAQMGDTFPAGPYSAFTVQFWHQNGDHSFNDVLIDGGGSCQVIFGNPAVSEGVQFFFPGGSILGNSTDWPKNSKWMITATYDNGSAKLYQNATLKSTASGSGTLTFPSSPRFQLATTRNSSTNHAGDTYFDELAFWDRALTGDEIAGIYNCGNDDQSASCRSCGGGSVDVRIL